jgi:hypothetical protein
MRDWAETFIIAAMIIAFIFVGTYVILWIWQ